MFRHIRRRRRRPSLLEEIESRILFSAEAAGLFASALPDPAAPQSVTRLIDSGAVSATLPGAPPRVDAGSGAHAFADRLLLALEESPPASRTDTDAASATGQPPATEAGRALSAAPAGSHFPSSAIEVMPGAAAAASGELRHEVVFIDASVADPSALLQQLATDGRSLEVIWIAAGSDGLSAITEALQGRTGLSAIHIISHGADGVLQVGGTTLDGSLLSSRALEIASWRSALAEDADLLIYGCDVAAGSEGAEFVARLAELTGADVAASVDLTGSSQSGGNWALEVQTGEIETQLALTAAAQQNWSGVLAVYNVTSNANSGAGTLRNAINSANANAGVDTIYFNLATPTINLSSELPAITEGVIIDATSQPGWSSAPIVTLDGGALASGEDGLIFPAGSDGSSVRGLVITAFPGAGIILLNTSNITVAGNYVGVDATGNADRGNGTDGIYLEGATGITIGGLNVVDRNVISANGAAGISFGAGSVNNSVLGNYIGLNAAGASALGNDYGIYMEDANNNTIGGTSAAARNVVSGNLSVGIQIDESSGNLIQGNYIGTDASGSASVGNGVGVQLGAAATGNTVGGTAAGAGNVISGNTSEGVRIEGSGTTGNTISGNTIGLNAARSAALANDIGVRVTSSAGANMIGGTAAGAGNLIASNTKQGVSIANTVTGVSILGNAIRDNGALGIDLGSTAGVTANDAGDGDSGANDLQNFPVLTSAYSNGSSTTINGTLNSTASTSFRIEFFSSPSADATGYGEGAVYLGYLVVTTAATNSVAFSAVLAGVSLASGQRVTATATRLNSGDPSSTSEFSQNVVSTANPVITSNGGGDAAAVNVAENNTAVTTVMATDADLPAQTLTYSISGGADAAKFTINASTGVLSFVTAPDYESPTDAGADNVYDVIVQVSDGTLTDTQAIAVTVTPVNDNMPVITSNGGGATAIVYVDENTTAVTTVTATDADLPAQTLTYSITGGADAAKFSINASTGVLSFLTAPDSEHPSDVGGDNQYEVTVQVSDGSLTDAQAISVRVRDVNDNAPKIISDGGGPTAAVSVAENTSSVLIVSATDADWPPQDLVYSISGGADAAKFSIDANTGELRFVSAPDYENPTDAGANNVYDVIVQVSDGSLTDTQAIAVTVTAVNDNAPVITSHGGAATATLFVDENDTAVTTVTATDADRPAQTLTYSISGGADAARFTIDASTGVLSFLTAPDVEAPADANADNVYQLTVQVSDGTFQATQTLSVEVRDVNDSAPRITSNGGTGSAAINVAENSSVVTTVTATDSDLPAQPLSYAIVGGADASLFSIDANTGALSFVSAPDFESPMDADGNNVYQVTVQVSDGGLTDTQSIAVTVTAVNDNLPVITSNGGGATAAVSVLENSTAVTTVTATDADLPAQTLNYSIIGGADAARFSIDASTGELSFVTAPDFENPTDAGGNNVYDVTVQVSDGALTSTQAIFVTVTAVNDNAPIITSNGGGATAALNVAENSSAVTTVTATDADLPAQTLSYSIAGGADAAKFTVNASTGVLTFVTAPDFENPTDVGADNIYDVIVQVSDGNLTDTQAIAVTVMAVNDNAPLITSHGGAANAVIHVVENATAVTMVTATDADLPMQTLSYSITGGADAAKFTVDASTGVLNFVTAPDHENPTDGGADNIYHVTVTVSDGSRTSSQAIAVTVTPVSDNTPVITSNGGATTAAIDVAENSTRVTTVTATDADLPAQTLSYAIVGGADAAFFSLDPRTGELLFLSAPDRELPLDADHDNVYQLRVQVSDGVGTAVQTLSVRVTNVIEGPERGGLVPDLTPSLPSTPAASTQPPAAQAPAPAPSPAPSPAAAPASSPAPAPAPAASGGGSSTAESAPKDGRGTTASGPLLGEGRALPFESLQERMWPRVPIQPDTPRYLKAESLRPQADFTQRLLLPQLGAEALRVDFGLGLSLEGGGTGLPSGKAIGAGHLGSVQERSGRGEERSRIEASQRASAQDSTRLAAKTVTAVVTFGVAWTSLHLTALLASAAAMQPVWNGIDPIPLLSEGEGEEEGLEAEGVVDEEAAHDELAATRLLEGASRAKLSPD